MSPSPHADQIANLYLPGLTPSGAPRTLVDASLGYWDQQASDQRRGGRGDAFLPELLDLMARRFRGAVTKASHPRGWRDGLGLATMIVLDQTDARTGAILQRTITANIVTDTGAQALLNLYNTPGSAGKYLVLHTDNATAVQTGSAINNASGAQTSIAVASGGSKGAVTANKAGSFISSTTGNAPTADTTTSGGIDWSYGTANSEIVSGSGTQSSAVAVAISSYTVAGGKTHSAGDFVVSRPQTGDAPTAAPAGAIIYNSGASTAGATGTAAVATISGTGIGNRQALWSSLVFTTTSTAGTYTGLAIVNFTTIAGWAAAGFYNSLSFPGQVISSSQSLTLTSYSVKI